MSEEVLHNILSIDDFKETQLSVSKEKWTVIISAAGTGSRLKYDKPKILYPILGEPIISWLFNALKGFVQEAILVLSPEGEGCVRPLLKNITELENQIVIQNQPRGMADAVHLCKDKVNTPNVIVLWGDQVTVRRETIQLCLHEHENRSFAKLTMPTIKRNSAYIHFVRDAKGKIVEVLEAREKPIPYEVGESDCGLFCFTSEVLFKKLDEARNAQFGIGKTTKEFNLLPLLAGFDETVGDVVSIRINDMSETIGINTFDEVKLVEEILRKR